MVSRSVWQKGAFTAGAALAASALAVTSVSATADVQGAGSQSGWQGSRATGAGPAAPAGLRPVAYRGYVFDIPRTWPVISLADHRATCVRFDRVFWKGADGRLWHTSGLRGHPWKAPAALSVGALGTGWHAPSTVPVGKVGGHVFAAGQRNGVVDVFWRGVRDPHLWHARYRPGGAWSGPDNLGGKPARGGK